MTVTPPPEPDPVDPAEAAADGFGAGELGADGSGAGELGAGGLGADGSGAGELGAGEFGAGELGAGGSRAGELGADGDSSLLATGRHPKSRVPLISAIVVACVAAGLIAILATSKNASSDVGSLAVTPLQDKPAPDITGATLNGGTDSLYSYRGKWILLNFFASWCVPCQQEQPELVKFQDAHPSDVVIFGVRFDDPDVGPIEQLMSKSGAKWPIVDDPLAKIVYSVTGPPESFLISPGGVVLVHIIGPTTDAQLEAILSQAELVVSTPTTSSPAHTSS